MAAEVPALQSSRPARLMIGSPCASYEESPACSLEVRILSCPDKKRIKFCQLIHVLNAKL